MAWRIHFTVKDLARTHVAKAPMPLIELDHAARALQTPHQAVRLDAWRHHARGRLTPQARMVLSLIPPRGYSFVFPERAGQAEELLDDARATPRKEITARLAQYVQWQTGPSWIRHLDDDSALFGQYVDGLASLYANLLSPHEPQLADLFITDRAVRMRQFLKGGIERVLTELNPRWVRWNSPTLEINTAFGADHDIYLQGQGVLLVPSLFGSRTHIDETAQPQPVVTYPAGHDQPLRRLTTLAPRTRGSGSAVSALLGNTRAAVLAIIAEHPGCSTKQLATLAKVAPASASEHATVLRQSGLIATTRHRNTAIHTPTELGAALLDQA